MLLFIASIVVSVVFLACFFAIPVFSAMFNDFGAQLPVVTEFMIRIRPIYAVAAVLSGPIAYYLLYRRKQGESTWYLIFGFLGLEYFVLIMSVAAMFMPIFQLGASTPK